jgi:hypothetical protein
MEFCDEAFFAKRNGDLDAFTKFSRQALELETEAANLLKDNFEAEPSRSILYRSAASIAIDCGKNTIALKLIRRALKGEPPANILVELDELCVLAKGNIERKQILRLRQKLSISQLAELVGLRFSDILSAYKQKAALEKNLEMMYRDIGQKATFEKVREIISRDKVLRIRKRTEKHKRLEKYKRPRKNRGLNSKLTKLPSDYLPAE